MTSEKRVRASGRQLIIIPHGTQYIAYFSCVLFMIYDSQCAHWTLNEIEKAFHETFHGVKKHALGFTSIFCLKSQIEGTIVLSLMVLYCKQQKDKLQSNEVSGLALLQILISSCKDIKTFQMSSKLYKSLTTISVVGSSRKLCLLIQ